MDFAHEVSINPRAAFKLMNSNKLELLYFPPKQFSPRFGENIFTAVIDDYERVKPIDGCASKFVVYNIRISRGRSGWVVKRRFTDFAKLSEYFKEKYKSTAQPFPTLPPKTWVSVVNDDQFLKERMNNLIIFLNEMLTTMHMEKILLDDKLTEFLEFHNNRSTAESI